jgi:hypothetical protein
MSPEEQAKFVEDVAQLRTMLSQLRLAFGGGAPSAGAGAAVGRGEELAFRGLTNYREPTEAEKQAMILAAIPCRRGEGLQPPEPRSTSQGNAG